MAKNLFMRGKGYSFRLQIPKELIGYFGRKEIVKSLRTRDYKQARLLLRQAQSTAESLFFLLRSGMIDKSQLANILRNYMDDCLKGFKEHRLGQKQLFSGLEKSGKLEPGIVPDIDFVDSIRDSIPGKIYLKHTPGMSDADRFRVIAEGIRRDSLDFKIPKFSRVAADDLLEEYELSIDKDSDDYSEFCRNLAKIQIKTFGEHANRLEGKYEYGYNDFVAGVIEDGYPITLKQAAVEFIEAKRIKGIKASTLATYEAGIKLLLAFYGDSFPVKEMSNPKVLKYVADSQKRGVKNITIIKRYRLLKEIVGFACANHGISKWEYKIDLKDDSAEIKPFSVEDLNSIFTHLAHRKIQKWKYWSCLIALLTGLRESEISALLVSDIREKEGIWYIAVLDSKTKAGLRDVPLPDILLELGFIEYLNERKQSKDKYLLMETVKSEYKQVSPDKLGDWFRNFKRLKQFLSPADMEIKRFHSFRHNFANALKQGKVLSEMREDLCGHESSGRSAQKDYVENYELDLKKQAINQARWGCDFTLLR